MQESDKSEHSHTSVKHNKAITTFTHTVFYNNGKAYAKKDGKDSVEFSVNKNNLQPSGDHVSVCSQHAALLLARKEGIKREFRIISKRNTH